VRGLALSLLGCGAAAACVAGCSVEAPGPGFRDVARERGLDFAHASGAEGGYRLPEIMGSGCAWLDADADGDLDAYLVSAGRDAERARNRLFANRLEETGAARFEDVSDGSGADHAGFGMGCAVGDYDGDGTPDLYLTNFGADALLANRGGGRFGDADAGCAFGGAAWTTSALFCDFDLDGHLDLYAAAYVDQPADEDHGGGACLGADGRPEYCGPLAHYPPRRDFVFHNRGDGGFEDASERAGLADVEPGYGLGVGVLDVDEDGWPDVFVANDGTPNHLWRARGPLAFEERAHALGIAVNADGDSEAGMGVAIGDASGDGVLDLLLTHRDGETHTLYRREGAAFRDATRACGLAAPSRPDTGFGLALLDADLDGALDLWIANGRIARAAPGAFGGNAERDRALVDGGYAERDRFLTGGGGRFTAVDARFAGPPPAPGTGRGLAACDFDRDGDVDLLESQNGGPARLLENRLERRGRWLALDLFEADGTRARDAVVTLEAGGRRQVRRAQPGASYLSSHADELVFGLGDARTADVRVRWSDGAEERRVLAGFDRRLAWVRSAPPRRPARWR